MNRLLIIILLVLSAVPMRGAEAGGMVGLGGPHFSLAAGNGYAYNSDYFILGASASVEVQDGLSVGLSAEKWAEGDRVSPSTRFSRNTFSIHRR